VSICVYRKRLIDREFANIAHTAISRIPAAMEAPLRSCTLSRDLGVQRLARTRFTSSFGELAAPFGLAPASQSVTDTVQRLRQQDELDLAPYELSLIHVLRSVTPMRPSATWTRRVEQACLGAAAAIVVLLTAGTQGWLS
jgi:hypothetical protein